MALLTSVAREAPAAPGPPAGNGPRAWLHRAAGWGPTIPLLLAALCLVLALVQDAGTAFADSRIELTADPGLALARMASVWGSTGDLGDLRSAQWVGYLFPMGPWFAGAQWLGIPIWIAGRVWIAAVLAVGAWGTVRLMDDLYDRRRGVAHLVAGAVFALNPYTVLFTSRATITLLAYVILPWLLLATHRGLAQRRPWLPAVGYAIALACAGGGVNAAVLPWVLLPTAFLAVYEVALHDRTWGDVLRFFWRALVVSVAASLWWLVPIAIQGKYGADFLSFTEQPSTVWATTSMSESLRLMGYWISYLVTSFNQGVPQPSVSVAPTYILDTWVLVATLIVPLVAFAGMRRLTAWRYGPFFGLSAALMLVVMVAGFPLGKPLSDAVIHLYYDIAGLQFLRTTYKAAPMVALGFACLGGATVASVLRALRGRRLAAPRRVAAFAAVGAATTAVLVLYALPMFTGRALDARLTYAVPAYWKAAITTADRTTPPNRRLMVVPGQLFAVYRWGMTTDSIVTALAKRPVLFRNIMRYAPAPASELQARVDDLIQQGRTVPGQLQQLLQLMAVGQLLFAADGRPDRSGEIGPADLTHTLGAAYAPGRAWATFGPTYSVAPTATRAGTSVRVPAVRLQRVPAAPGLVRVQPQHAPTVLSGDADGITELAAHGELQPGRALLYSGSLSPAATRTQVDAGAELVFTDTNRREALLASQTGANVSATFGAGDPLPDDLPHYDLFDAPATQTVATETGLRFLRASYGATFAFLPQNRPFALFDGNLDMPWLPQTSANLSRWVELGLAHPHPARFIEIHPHVDRLAATNRVGISVNGGAERIVPLHAGWNRVAIDASRLSTLRLRIAGLRASFYAAPGGIDELRVPGIHPQESLKLPTDLATKTAGLDLRGNDVQVLLSRRTADFPGRAGADSGPAQLQSPLDMVDAETTMRRTVTLPAARSFTPSGWGSVGAAAPDPSLDALVGLPAPWRYTSTGRFAGVPIYRASSAFDGNPATSWVSVGTNGGRPTLSWRAPTSTRIARLHLAAGPTRFRFPTRVRIDVPGAGSQIAAVGHGGDVVLAYPVRTRSMRLTVLASRPLATGPPPLFKRLFVPSSSAFLRPILSINIRRPRPGDLSGAVAISEVTVPGLRFAAVRHTGTFTTGCGEITATGPSGSAALRASGTVAALDASDPLRLTPCGPGRTVALPAGASTVTVAGHGPILADHVRLDAPGTTPTATPPVAGSVDQAATNVNGSSGHARVRVAEPSWLVLAESYSPGWTAQCNGRDLGAPTLVDGYANGWKVGPGCTRATFAFAPQRAANISYLLSILAAVVMAAFLVLSAVRIRRRRAAGVRSPSVFPEAWHPVPDAVLRLRWRTIALAAPVAGVVAGYVFAWRIGLVLAVAVVLIGRVGATARRLFALTGALLVLVILAYLLQTPPGFGAISFQFAVAELRAHELAVLAVLAFSAGCALVLRDHRAASRVQTSTAATAASTVRHRSAG